MKILFVCTGNICRSPTAEGVLRHKAAARGLAHVVAASAATHAYHIGAPPDERTRRHALARGYDLAAQRARQVRPADFAEFDRILAMDREHHRLLSRLAGPSPRARLRLFMDYAPGFGSKDCPDPYYGDADGFERVLDIVEAGVEYLLDEIEATR